jgi:hypothetical protein
VHDVRALVDSRCTLVYCTLYRRISLIRICVLGTVRVCAAGVDDCGVVDVDYGWCFGFVAVDVEFVMTDREYCKDGCVHMIYIDRVNMIDIWLWLVVRCSCNFDKVSVGLVSVESDYLIMTTVTSQNPHPNP